MLKFESSLDWFGGAFVGNSPWNSPEVHRANVQNLQGYASINVTWSNKIEIGKFIRLDLEFDFGPILFEG